MYSLIITLSLVILNASSLGGEGLTVSREAVVEQLDERVVLTAHLRRVLSDAEQEQFLELVRGRVRLIASEELPSVLPLPRDTSLEQITPTLLLDSADRALLDLLIRKAAMDMKIQVGFMRDVDGPSPEMAEKIEESVDKFFEEVLSKMVSRLSPMIEVRAVSSSVDELRASLKRKIVDRGTYALKVPIEREQAQEFLEEFDQRLAVSVERAKGRLEASAGGDRPSGETGLPEQVSSLVLQEVLVAPSQFVARSTIDPALASIDPNRYAPGYRDLVKRVAAAQRAPRMEPVNDQTAPGGETGSVSRSATAPGVAVVEEQPSSATVKHFAPSTSAAGQKAVSGSAALRTKSPGRTSGSRFLVITVSLGSVLIAIVCVLVVIAVKRSSYPQAPQLEYDGL